SFLSRVITKPAAREVGRTFVTRGRLPATRPAPVGTRRSVLLRSRGMPRPPPLVAPEFPTVALGEIVENRPVAKATWILKVHAPSVAPAIRPAQFVNLRTSDGLVPLLRRPMSVHRVIRQHDTPTGFAVLYDVVGPGTRALATMPKG